MAVATHPETPVKTGETLSIPVKNPVTNEVIGSVPVTSREEVARAVERARQAQPAWAALSIKERAKILRRWGDLVWERQQEVMDIIRRETGKNSGVAYNEVLITDAHLNYYCHHAARILKTHRRASVLPGVHTAKVVYHPHGVVGIISPWNFPFNLPFMDSLPALMAGNAVVYKPSEITPYSCEFGVKLLHEAGVPRDVAQIVHGDGRTGAALVDYVDYIGFTGSTPVGRKVAMRAAERLIPYSLELGGKDPMIVLNDADVEMAATGMLRGAFENAGQFCMSIERVYVEEGIYDKLVDRVQHWAKQYVVSNEAGEDVHMGSLTNQRELERTEAHIQDAVAKGAKLVHGGKRRPELGPLFYEATVLTDVDHSMDVMRDETFGPILPIMKVKNAEEAVRLANDNEYGLAAAVFTGDRQRGEQIARQIVSGDVAVNATQFVIGTPGMPSGGMKDSGIGRRNGPEGLLRYVKVQSIVLNNGLGQKPALNLLDAQTKRIILLLRSIRRYVPFI